MLDQNRPPNRGGLKFFKLSFSLPAFTLLILALLLPNSGASIKTAASQKRKLNGKVIYGSDDRHELYEETDPEIRRMAGSTLALIQTSDLKKIDDNTISIRTENYGQRYHLCSTERFREQDTGAFCSGFLVAPELVMTAGHCIRDLLDCQRTAFVFGFAYSTPNAQPAIVAEKDVYGCRELIRSVAESSGVDFAIIRLDRPVNDRSPLRLRRTGAISPGDELTVLGHPAGLPLKIANGAQVRSVNPKGYFLANLDTYGGNSGSPVIGLRSQEVEGILVRGAQDYVLSEENGSSCFISNQCPDDQCSGEAVTLISEVLKLSEIGID